MVIFYLAPNPTIVGGLLVDLWKSKFHVADPTYYHLNHLPSAHHFIVTLFNKILEKGVSPACWGSARIKLIYKSVDSSDPSNFYPIALTCVIGKLFHKIISHHLEDYLIMNNVIDTTVQKGFITGLSGVFEYVYSVSYATRCFFIKKPLMITFLDLKNAFGSVPHKLIFDMLRAVKVPSTIQIYIESFYSQLYVTVTSRSGNHPQFHFGEEYFKVIPCHRLFFYCHLIHYSNYLHS